MVNKRLRETGGGRADEGEMERERFDGPRVKDKGDAANAKVSAPDDQKAKNKATQYILFACPVPWDVGK
jgi:hypothetical protein